MSVTMVGQYQKRSTGFTIDSIIGKRDKTESGESSVIKQSNIHRISQVGYLTNAEDRRVPSPVHDDRREKNTDIANSHRVNEGINERHSPLDTERTYKEHALRLHQQLLDPLKHLQGQSPESLKHLQDVLAQTAGATGTYVPPPRVCRHPLSALNLHSVYPSPALPQSSPLHPLVFNPASRDVRGVNPWMSDRYSNYYYPRYPVATAPGFLFQPYRKPKRIRTAFSPSQLLQLEKAFEKSHYVVGQERKDLASELQLTETQVKVWFQNRRTKHKRIKSEDGSMPSSDHEDDHHRSTQDGHHGSMLDIDSDLSDDMDASDDEITVDHDI